MLDYNIWLNSGNKDFDLIYFDINNDVDKIKKVNEDYNYRLRPFIINNYDKLKTHIQLIKQ